MTDSSELRKEAYRFILQELEKASIPHSPGEPLLNIPLDELKLLKEGQADPSPALVDSLKQLLSGNTSEIEIDAHLLTPFKKPQNRSLYASQGKSLMPRRDDIKKVMIIGSGPIIIGQACEFDYSGTQACKALKSLGYQIVLVNSNPATIMTDPGMADATYIEPLNLETMIKIIEKERPDAILPNLGGQTGLNLSSALATCGALDKYRVRVIGVDPEAIRRGEDRLAFKETMQELGIDLPKSKTAYSVEEAEQVAMELGYPVIIWFLASRMISNSNSSQPSTDSSTRI